VSAFPDVVFGGASFVKRDVIRFYYPVWRFAVERMKEGVLPLWNPHNSYGAPFLADIQTCVLYPLTLILYLPDYRWAFNFYILLHVALAGFFTCIWMRECKASRPAAFLAGLAYSFGGYVMSAISLTISLCTLIYLPLALFTLKRSFDSDRFFWKGAAALVLLVQYLGGDPAVFFATLVTLTLVASFKTLEESLRRKRFYVKYMTDFITVMALFAGLSLFQTLLFFEFLMNSNRAGLTHDLATMWGMMYNDLIAFFFPYFSDISIVFMDYWDRQSWLENAYTGITVFFLATGAVIFSARTDRNVRYHAALAFLGIFLALGRYSLVHTFFYYCFPFFKFIRYPVRFLFLFSFAAACLAGFGLDALLSRSKAAKKEGRADLWPRIEAALLLLLTALVALSLVFSRKIELSAMVNVGNFFRAWSGHPLSVESIKDLTIPVLSNLRRTAELVAFCLLGSLAARYFKPRASLLGAYFILLVFVDLSLVNVIEIRLPGEVLDRPSANLSKVIEDKDVFRVLASPQSVALQYQPPGQETFDLTLRALRETLTPNLLLPYQIGDVSGYDSIFLRDAIRVNEDRLAINSPVNNHFYDMANVKYLVSPRETIGEGYRLIQNGHPVNLFLNEHVLPRAFLVREAEFVPDRNEALKRILAPDYDPRAKLFVEQEVPLSPNSAEEDHESTVHLTHYGPNEVRMDVSAGSEKWLFLSDMYYPGWRAAIDGKSSQIYRANYAFRALRVPAGKHKVEWKYDPILFKIGSAVSLLTFLGILIGFWRGRRLHA